MPSTTRSPIFSQIPIFAAQQIWLPHRAHPACDNATGGYTKAGAQGLLCVFGDARFGVAGQGFKYPAQMPAQERLVAAIGFIATAHTAFELTLDCVKERCAFGKPFGAFQNARFKMAQMRAQLDMAQTYFDQCVKLHNSGELSAEDASAAKLLSSKLEARVMGQCVQFHGGTDCMEKYCISRMYTDARFSRIFAGTSEIMLEIIDRGLGLDDSKMN